MPFSCKSTIFVMMHEHVQREIHTLILFTKVNQYFNCGINDPGDSHRWG